MDMQQRLIEAIVADIQMFIEQQRQIDGNVVGLRAKLRDLVADGIQLSQPLMDQ
ncbi:hypothetical protein HDV05_008747, partial [Chytridiales sp. JEL 0842]